MKPDLRYSSLVYDIVLFTYSLHVFSKQLWHDVKDFFVRMFDPNISPGAKDYYAVMLFFDLLCFLTIVFGVNSFGVSKYVTVLIVYRIRLFFNNLVPYDYVVGSLVSMHVYLCMCLLI